MKAIIFGTLLLSFTSTVVGQNPDRQGIDANEVIARMSHRDAERETKSGGYAGTRRYVLQNDHLHKRAELVASVQCDPNGTKHFEVVSESGWGSANKRVLRKMLESEAETSNPSIRPKTRLNADNYDFSMVGTATLEGRLTYVIDAAPKRRDKYLMEGRVWVDATDYALLKADGKPAHNPSFWTRSIHFVQQYRQDGAFWFPQSTDSVTEARIFGTTRVSITYSDYIPNTLRNVEKASLREAGYETH